MGGFFSSRQTTSQHYIPPIAECGACGLWKGCQTPKMDVGGQGRRSILVVGEAPDATSDQYSKPFHGSFGEDIRRTLRKYHLDIDVDCWITYSLRCSPPSEVTNKAVGHCRPYVVQAIKQLKPERIFLFGQQAIRSVLGWLWKEDPGAIQKWIGWTIPSQRLNAWICPFWSADFVQATEARWKGRTPVRILWERQIERAVNLSERPWKEVPSYDKEIKTIFNPTEAAETIRRQFLGATDRDAKFAVDFETTTLKPDGPDARIFSCSLSDGKCTIAYPWTGAVIEATGEFLRSGKHKIGANIKFEERFSIAEFGHGVNGWTWDTVLNAHILDNRADITGVKFQAFVLLGQERYDDHIEPFLKSENANKANNIHKLPLKDVLKYNGMDALVEWHIAERQAKMLGRSLC